MEVFSTLMGVTFRGGDAREIVKRLTPDDGDQLALVADPNNEYDSNAVMVMHRPTDCHIGFLAKENNFDVSEHLRNGGGPLKIEIVGFENTLKPTLLITDANDDVAPTAEDMGIYPGER
jgi:hypothetical protein